MKLLMFLAPRFQFRAYEKMLPEAPDSTAEETIHDAAIIFAHTDADDPPRASKVVTKAAKNIKWLAGKMEFRTVVLHSFNHLGPDKAEPDDARDILERIADRLRNAGYTVIETPFGHVCEWDLSVVGPSIGKVFKEI